jgi:hypothetical protein
VDDIPAEGYATGMSLRPSWRAVLAAVIAAAILHTVTALWVWRTWGYFGRANVIAWIDFPVSLTFLHLDGDPMIELSLLLGGLQWAAIGGVLALLLGRSVRQPASKLSK